MQEQILQALRRNAATEAVALARQWCEQSPQDPQALRWLGLALQQQGANHDAMAAFDAALALAPEDADLHLLRAGLLIGGQDLEGASDALARSTELNPNQFAAYILQANLAIARGDLDEAERLANTARRIQPDDAQLQVVDGTLSLRRGNAERALALLSAAAQRLPDDPRLMFSLGFAYLHNGHLAFAERALQRAAELNPPGTTLRALVAQLMQRQGRPDEARQLLAEVMAQPEGDTPAMHRLAGEMALQMGDLEAALNEFKPVLATWPGDRRTLQGALLAWQRLDRINEAKATLEAALATAPQQPELWLARLSLEPVGGDAALAQIERWLQAMPEHLPALEALMRIHDMRNDNAGAEAAAERIVALEPGRLTGEQRLVEGLMQRDPDAAVARVQGLLDGLPEGKRGALWLWLGRVQDQAGRQPEALQSWMQFHDEQAGLTLPLPPLSSAGNEWHEMGEIAADNPRRPLLLWGAPGSQVERVVTLMGAASRVLRGDRFGATPPNDPLQNYHTVERLQKAELAPAELVQQWQAQLPARGIADGNVIDWLLWWDNSLLQGLRPHLPEGRLAVVLRDPRDMLLDWLAAGAPAPFTLASPLQASQWLAQVLSQIAELHEQDLYPHVLLRVDGAEADPQAMAALLGEAFGHPFPVLPSLGTVRLAPGRWRVWQDVLAPAFELLTPVAQRLGYPAQ